MKVVKFFDLEREKQYHWISQIGRSDWRAAKYLHELLLEEKLRSTLGDDAELLLLTQGEELVSFCTFAKRDEIPDCELFPWVGFVFTFAQFRGRRCFGILLEAAEAIAQKRGFEKVYVSTNENGLYEKYGFKFLRTMKDCHGEDSRIYVKETLSVFAPPPKKNYP